MHIAIEGLDGVGKTSTAKLVAERLGFAFIEKPLHYLTDKSGMEQYLYITKIINETMSQDFTAMFYGTGNLYLSYLKQDKNVVTDRYLCSTYFWNQNDGNTALFDYLAKACVPPDITIILFASASVRKARICHRNPNDPDLLSKVLPDSAYDRMKQFCERYSFPYIWIDTSESTLEDTVDQIIQYVKDMH